MTEMQEVDTVADGGGSLINLQEFPILQKCGQSCHFVCMIWKLSNDTSWEMVICFALTMPLQMCSLFDFASFPWKSGY